MTMRERRGRRVAVLTVRHGRQRTAHPVATLFKVLGAAVAVVAVSAACVAGFAVTDIYSSASRSAVHLVSLPGQKAVPPPKVGAIEGDVNLLIAGTDTRTGQGGQFDNRADLAASSGVGNNDVTMLLHIAADHKSATVVSFPRDLMVPIPACPRANGGTYPASSLAMFNSALSRGGLSCVVLTVEKMTGVQIPYAALTTFDGVIAMSNAVGGVDVCIATPIKDPYTGLNLPAGTQTIEGDTALAFLRTRHGVADGSDLGRISNQQVFMSALARKVTSAGVLSNPIQLYGLAKAAVSSLTLSDTLTNPTTMVSMGLALKSVGLQNMVFLQYPTASDPSNPNRVVPITSAAAVLNGALVNDQPVTLTGKVGRAAVDDPNAPAPPSTAPATAPPATDPAPSSSAVALPSQVTGQTAAQQTCTKGN